MRYFKINPNISYIFLFVTVVVAVLLVLDILPSLGDIEKPVPKEGITGNKFMGADSCGSSNCHGGSKPRAREGININQNEYSIWFSRDAHRKAFDVLLKPDSRQIARNLRLPDPPDESEKCLVCHTTFVPAALWGKDFDFSDGVSCESCHGAAEQWLGPHTQTDWNDDKAADTGMNDTKNLFARAELCLSCHIGDSTKTVDHELIAAGHPDLSRFEFDTYLSFMPPHWRKDDENEWDGTKVWTVGQATALKQSMDQLARRAGNQSWNPWPEFAEFNCYSCHHDLENDSWRQKMGYSGQTPGFPPWNSARYILLRPVAGKASPGLADTLDREVKTLARLLDRVGYGSPSQVAATASRISSTVFDIQAKLGKLQFDQNLTYDLLVEISADGNQIGRAGIRAAQQAAVALETLFYTYSQNVEGPNNRQISMSISELFSYLERPEGFTPGGFSSRMKKINGLMVGNR